MDRLTQGTAFAAVLLSLMLSGCGGGNSSADAGAIAPATGGGTTATIQGVTTPSTVSVVTAKNAN